MRSLIQQGGRVPFPDFTGERVYMRRFTKAEGLPSDLRRWQPTVDAMLHGVEATGPCYLMVDQAEVEAGALHRRGGLHVDLNWMGVDWGWRRLETGWAQGGWERPDSGWKPAWNRMSSQGIILAANLLGSRALLGDFDGAAIGDGGDASAVALEGLQSVDLLPGIAWAGEASALIHEALPLAQAGQRTVVRLHVEDWLLGAFNS